MSGRNQGAALGGRFDDENPECSGCDQPIAARKIRRLRRRPEWKFAGDGATSRHNRSSQCMVLGWVDAVDPGTDKRNGGSALIECTLVGCTIDSAGQAA